MSSIDQKRYPLWGLLQAFRLLNLDLTRILANASLPPALRCDDAASGTAGDMRRLFAAAMHEADGPDFGLRLAVTFTRVPCGITFYGFHAAATFGEALRLLIRYKSDSAPEVLTGVTLDSCFELHLEDPGSESPSFGALLTFSWLVEMQRVVYREATPPRAVTLTGEVPDIELYERHLECSVTRGPADCITFDRAALHASPLTRDPSRRLFGLSADMSLRTDGPVREPPYGDVVRAVLRRNLDSGEVGATDIANALGISARTLQRRLAAEGATLSGLLEAVRRELALELLQGGRAKISEIAWRLGYADPANFHRSFKAWFGMTPTEYRRGAARSA